MVRSSEGVASEASQLTPSGPSGAVRSSEGVASEAVLLTPWGPSGPSGLRALRVLRDRFSSGASDSFLAVSRVASAARGRACVKDKRAGRIFLD